MSTARMQGWPDCWSFGRAGLLQGIPPASQLPGLLSRERG